VYRRSAAIGEASLVTRESDRSPRTMRVFGALARSHACVHRALERRAGFLEPHSIRRSRRSPRAS